jgi:hypothetical protein
VFKRNFNYSPIKKGVAYEMDRCNYHKPIVNF